MQATAHRNRGWRLRKAALLLAATVPLSLPVTRTAATKPSLGGERSQRHLPRARQVQTNPLERVNREIGRRTDVVGSFPHDAALRRLAGMLLGTN